MIKFSNFSSVSWLAKDCHRRQSSFVTAAFYPWGNLIVLSLVRQLFTLPPWNSTWAGYGLVCFRSSPLCFEGDFLGSPHWLLYQPLPMPLKADRLGTVVGDRGGLEPSRHGHQNSNSVAHTLLGCRKKIWPSKPRGAKTPSGGNSCTTCLPTLSVVIHCLRWRSF